MGTHVAQSTRLPVFIVGSSRNAAVICRALQTSDGLFGAVLIGNASPPLLSEQLAQSLGPNTKPDAVLEWCLRQLSNHLNPTWRFK
jgi:hypothetical protein